MTKLFVLPLMLASTAGIMGSTAAEARPGVYGQGPGGGFSVHTPRKRCTRKNPCSPMPELPFFPGEIQPMPRGGLQPYPGTQWRR